MSPTSYQTAPSRDIKFSTIDTCCSLVPRLTSCSNDISHFSLGRVSRVKFSYIPLLNAKKQKSIPMIFYLKMCHTYNYCRYVCRSGMSPVNLGKNFRKLPAVIKNNDSVLRLMMKTLRAVWV